MKPSRTSYKAVAIVLSLVALVLAIILGGYTWLYNGGLTSAKFKVFKAFRLPVGKVGVKSVTPTELSLYVADVNNGAFASAQSKTAEALKLDAVAHGKVTVTKAEIEDAAQRLEGDALYIEAVKRYGKEVAAQSVVKEYILDAKLRAWYASHAELEPAYQQKLAKVKEQLAKGEPFAEVAAEYSDDSATKWFGGDAGYVDLNKAIAEYRDAVQKLSKGQRGIVYSRYGAHVVEVLDTVTQNGKTMVRLREVVIQPKAYDAWLDQQKQAVPVVWYVR